MLNRLKPRTLDAAEQDTTSIVLRNVDVEYPLLGVKSRSLRHSLIQTASGRFGKDRSDHLVVKALRDISFELKQGDRVALLGANGAGKSTLLRVLAGVYEPVRGERIVKGTVAALLAVGIGIRDDITGWENIRIIGTLMNMSAVEIAALSTEIAEFSELGEFLDLPVMSYSAGMRARLAFSIATCVKPDILLVDEIFGAGDAHFADKSLQRMRELFSESNIVVFASHSEDLLFRFCDKGLLLDQGELVAFGDIGEVLERYRKTRETAQ
ncbi:MAG TPA: ABC transporter ATP-binding protein [Xanthobacteraceae bacterium]|nr:ABC transporter ATP-binding protein [Xanthobacteraceae bacterium]